TLEFFDNDAAESLLSSLNTQDNIVNAWMFDPNRELFANYSISGMEDYDFPYLEGDTFQEINGFLILTREIKSHDILLGNIMIRADMSLFYDSLLNNGLILLAAIIIGIVFAFILALRTQKSISTPILKLLNTTKNVTETGDYTIRAEKMSSDEIGNLFDGFNDMLYQIQVKETERENAEKKVRDYQENLEKMVEERTDELKSAMEKLQLTQYAVDNAGDAVWWLHSKTAELVYINRVAYKSLGYKKNEMLNMKIPDIDPFVTKKVWKELVKKLKNGEILTFESRHKRKDGLIFPVEITAQYIEFEGSGRIVAFSRDITERKKAESKLKESEKKANDILEFAPDGMVIIDDSAKILKVNSQVEKMLGYERGGLLGQKIEALVPEKIRKKHVGFRNKYINDPELRAKGVTLELTAQCKNGELLPVDISLSSIELEEGALILASLRDITEKKEKENISKLSAEIGDTLILDKLIKEKLQICSEAFVKNLDAAFARIWTVDEDERLLNLQSSAGLYTHIDGTRKTVKIGKKKIGKIAASKKPYINLNVIEDPLLDEKEWARKNGLVAFSGFPMLVEGKNVGVLAMFFKNEISDYYLESLPAISNNIAMALMRDRAEEQLKFAKLAAEQANQAKSVFLANMSHDIRTPMNAVLGFAEILNTLIKDKQQREYLKSIRSSGKSLLTLINDILDLSKVEAGKLEFEYTVVDVVSVFDDMKQMFSHKVQEKEIDFIIEADPEIPKALILDENRLRQILINLIGNAVKFTDSGHVKIKAYANSENGDASSPDLYVSVEDTGIGIPDDQKDKVFEAFEQTKGQSTAKFGGTGLGLAITKKLITMMNGEVNVTGELGKGSSFNVHFKKVDVASVVEEETITDSSIDIENIKFAKSTILVVDDVETNRKLVMGYLGPFGFDMIEAENGKEMVELTGQHKPDIVLADMKMPVMNGYEATKILKNDPELKNIPIVAITASVMMKDEDNVKDICDGYLKKPVSKTDIVRELIRFLKYSTGDTEMPEMEQVEGAEIEAEVTSGSPEKLPELLEKLKTDFEPLWNELKDTLTINEVEDFALDIKETGRK
ncbi:PAS domain S-box protein, partial [candidate division KSB1 bacterium]